ncbi:hypothetical protein M9458_056806 [Cirrhinus mrigala]|uniref:Uncharacterized protein n=1 Tax=Cirrhinus mrigala TaxID=683832 RepID=A0ABD0MG41_CIRMR
MPYRAIPHLDSIPPLYILAFAFCLPLSRSRKCASMSQTSSRNLALSVHQNHLETQQSIVMDILQPKVVNNLQQQRKEQQDYNTELANHRVPWGTNTLSEQSHGTTTKTLTEWHKKKITSLHEALIAAGHQAQLEKTIRQDLERQQFHTKTLLETVEFNERDIGVKDLEGHLHAARA